MHVAAGRQETSARPLLEPSFGLDTTDQVVPSQDSIRVLLAAKPTAVQSLSDVQETPLSLPPSKGLGATDQVVPSQDSMRGVACACVFVWEKPTAVHAAAVAQETPCRTLTAGSGLGLGTMDQVVPFHDSTMVFTTTLPPPFLLREEPTAVHAVGEVQETPRRTLAEGSGLGLGTMDQVVPFQDSMSVFDPPVLVR